MIVLFFFKWNKKRATLPHEITDLNNNSERYYTYYIGTYTAGYTSQIAFTCTLQNDFRCNMTLTHTKRNFYGLSWLFEFFFYFSLTFTLYWSRGIVCGEVHYIQYLRLRRDVCKTRK